MHLVIHGYGWKALIPRSILLVVRLRGDMVLWLMIIWHLLRRLLGMYRWLLMHLLGWWLLVNWLVHLLGVLDWRRLPVHGLLDVLHWRWLAMHWLLDLDGLLMMLLLCLAIR